MMKEAYIEECLHEIMIFLRHKTFSKGREPANFIPHSGSIVCTETNTNIVATIVQDDRHLSYRALARHMNVSKLSIYKILTEILKMKRVCSTRVLYVNCEQVNRHGTMCVQLLLTLVENPQYLERVITCDKSYN